MGIQATGETSFDKVYSADFNVIDTNLIQMVLGASWIQENKHVDGASPVGILVDRKIQVRKTRVKIDL